MRDWFDLSVDEQNDIVNDCINLLATFTRVYGSEDGQVVWDRLGETLGDDIKSAVFFAMLTGEAGHVTIQNYPNHLKVSVIKIIREATGLGLREAKDLSESARCRFAVKYNTRSKVIRDLRDIGATVS